MKKNNKWLMFLILLISAITVGVSQLKIAAVMQDVAAALGVSTTQAALLMQWLWSAVSLKGFPMQ